MAHPDEHLIQFSPAEWKRVARLAERDGVAPRAAIMESVDKRLQADAPPSAHDLLKDLAGSVEGPADLSSRKGFGPA